MESLRDFQTKFLTSYEDIKAHTMIIGSTGRGKSIVMDQWIQEYARDRNNSISIESTRYDELKSKYYELMTNTKDVNELKESLFLDMEEINNHLESYPDLSQESIEL